MATVSQYKPDEWVFVTTTPKRPRPTKGQRSQMRRRVMREIGYTRRNTQSSSNFFAVDLQSGSSQNPELSPSSARIPPFLGNPDAFDRESHCLLHHMFSDAIPSQFQIYKDRWYPICITNPAAFDQMMATYATHITQCHPQHELKEFILKNHTKALMRVRNDVGYMLLGNKQILKGTLTAIAALACYSHLQRDMVSWRSHMAAVARLLYETELSLECLDRKLATLIKWVDLIGSYALDIPPTLGDIDGRVEFTHFPCDSVPLCLYSVDLPAPLLSAFQSLHWANTHVLQQKSICSNPSEVDRFIYPIIHRFLSFHYDAYTFGPTCSSIRSGVLLYLAEFRRMSGINPVVTEVHVRQLRFSMETLGSSSVPSELVLWLLTVGALEATATSNQDFFYSRILLLFQALKINSIECWRQSLTRIVWSDAVFDRNLEIIWSLL